MYKDIIKNFRKTFLPMKGARIALYGSGELSKLILGTCQEFHFVGIIDSNYKDTLFCGGPVLSMEEIDRWEISCIIIVARKSSVEIIRNRIQSACRKRGIRLFDVYGNDMSAVTPGRSIQYLEKYRTIEANDFLLKHFIPAYQAWQNAPTAKQFGYTFVAPILMSFCKRLLEYIWNGRFDDVWLLSRDGFLIKKCLDLLNCHVIERQPDFVYLLASRLALQDDRRYQNYLPYLLEKGGNRERILVVDFAATGTCQEGLEILLNKKLHGYYFLHIMTPDKAGLLIDAYQTVWEYADESTAIYQYYLLLELLVSSTEPSIMRFDEKCRPIYSSYSLDSSTTASIVQAQEGVLDFFRQHSTAYMQRTALPDMSLCDDILNIGVHENLNGIVFANCEYYDDYYGRKYYLPLPCNHDK